MTFKPSYLAGVFEIRPRVFKDHRGFFLESYNERVFAAHGIAREFVQDNYSFSNKGVIRGLHFQRPPHAQAKLVRVARGRALDVVVDLRHGSPTFGQIDCFELSADANNMVWIPEGFAHGFEALEETILMYKCSGFYDRDSEDGIIWSDPALDIPWQVKAPQISDKDTALPLFQADGNYF
ncbi:MAG: dTDP-4-dehydrorhamnose 3,5-epimerase [Catalinimonas sp.]